MSQFAPELERLKSTWRGPAITQVQQAVSLLRLCITMRNHSSINTHLDAIRSRMVDSFSHCLTVASCSYSPCSQMLFLTLTNDEAALEEHSAEVRRALLLAPEGARLEAEWVQQWKNRRAAALETSLVAEKVLMQLQHDQLEALVVIAIRDPGASPSVITRLKRLRGRVQVARNELTEQAVHTLFTCIADIASQATLANVSPSELAWKAEYTSHLLRQLAYADDFAVIGRGGADAPIDLTADTSDGEYGDMPPLEGDEEF